MAVNYRQLHKNALSSIIGAISYIDPVNNQEITLSNHLFTKWVNLGHRDLHIAISSGEMSQVYLDSCSVEATYTYYIHLSLKVNENIRTLPDNADIYREDELDIIESELVHLLSLETTRTNLFSATADHQLIDVAIAEVTTPYPSADEVETSNSHISKTFTVQVITRTKYEQ
jgi:hypothetical protein